MAASPVRSRPQVRCSCRKPSRGARHAGTKPIEYVIGACGDLGREARDERSELGFGSHRASRGDARAHSGSDANTVRGAHVLVAGGRRPNTDELGLENTGIQRDKRGYIQGDDQLRTGVEGVWAMGDCNGRGAFTHTSYNDFEIVAANLLDNDPRRVSDRSTD